MSYTHEVWEMNSDDTAVYFEVERYTTPFPAQSAAYQLSISANLTPHDIDNLLGPDLYQLVEVIKRQWGVIIVADYYVGGQNGCAQG